jgi:twitching motility two-component system response regulator PilH
VKETTPTAPQNSSEHSGRILVLEPEEELASKIFTALREAAPSAKVSLTRALEEAQHLGMTKRPDLFVLDVDAVPDLGQDFLYDLRTSHPTARAIILTGVHGSAHRERVAGLGAIHFLEKPFPHADFVDLVQALLSASGEPDSEKFQGTLSDLHLADIIQLKCMSGSSAVLQFTGPQGEKARVYFENGQVRHATAPGKEGIAAFNEIVNWKGGQISEVSGAAQPPRTIDLDWQVLLMEAVRKLDEARNTARSVPAAPSWAGQKVLVIDDSLMLLSFVKEILAEANYDVTTAPTAEEGLVSARRDVPDLVLLDYVLPDMKGDEVSRHLSEDSSTAKVPVVYMSGFGADLKPDQTKNANVIGSLNKPFTSDLLLATVERYMPKTSRPVEARVPDVNRSSFVTAPVTAEPEAPTVPESVTWQEPESAVLSSAAIESESAGSVKPLESELNEAPQAETASIAESVGAAGDAWWSVPSQPPVAPSPQSQPSMLEPAFESDSASQIPDIPTEGVETPATRVFLAGDTTFFSLSKALQAIGREKITGILHAYWNKETVELIARNGEIVLATTRDPQLYCPEAPITLVNVEAEQIEQARAKQRESGCPFFLALAQEELILHEPAVQLVQHYGQKLFAQVWTAEKVRFIFEQRESLPDYCHDVPGEADVDHWVLTTLRCIQSHELLETSDTEADRIPAYTRNGYERVQELRLTVAEAQFASQFNGVRSIAQIAKNLRLDFKLARLTLFRFLALEIVECWPSTTAVSQEKRGFFQNLGKSIGLGD